MALYLFGLGGPYVPTNGDEMVYIHIARMTAESGHWLPLQSELLGTRNTKPPLLIWQAMVSGGWGQHWSLWALRLPSVIYTFATTALLALFAYRMSSAQQGKLRTACLAAVVYLLFFSSFRYGRAYLTSAPETFWLALPMWWVLHLRLRGADASAALGWKSYSLFGLALGLGAAYKSFALVAPAAGALWCAVLCSAPQRHWPAAWPVLQSARAVWRTSVGVSYSTLLGLGVFALWFLLDPNPAAVWQEFIVAENAGKMSGSQGYWHAALFGTYPVWTQLWAYPANAGLLALPVLAYLWLGVRWAIQQLHQRIPKTSLPPALRLLVLWLLVWLVVFSIPSQRSERYVIPAMPALALLMALAWERIGRWASLLTLLIAATALVMLGRIAWVVGWELEPLGSVSSAALPSALNNASTWASAALLLAGAGGAAVILGLRKATWTRNAALTAVAAVYATFGCMVQPLSSGNATYSRDVQRTLAGQHVAVPNGFTGQYERFHLLLPHTNLTPYDAGGSNTGALFPEMPTPQRLGYLLSRFDAVVWLQNSAEGSQPSCLPTCTVIAQRWHVRSRHRSGEVTLQNLWYPQQWLFAHEWLITPTTTPSAFADQSHPSAL